MQSQGLAAQQEQLAAARAEEEAEAERLAQPQAALQEREAHLALLQQGKEEALQVGGCVKVLIAGCTRRSATNCTTCKHVNYHYLLRQTLAIAFLSAEALKRGESATPCWWHACNVMFLISCVGMPVCVLQELQDKQEQLKDQAREVEAGWARLQAAQQELEAGRAQLAADREEVEQRQQRLHADAKVTTHPCACLLRTLLAQWLWPTACTTPPFASSCLAVLLRPDPICAFVPPVLLWPGLGC